MFKALWSLRRDAGKRGEDVSIVALIRRLFEDAAALARAELRLAQAEVKENIVGIAKPVAMIAFGMLLAVAALFTLMGALVGFLAPYVGPGFAGLIVAVVVGAIAGALMLTGKKEIAAAQLLPSRAVAALRDDIETLKGE